MNYKVGKHQREEPKGKTQKGEPNPKSKSKIGDQTNLLNQNLIEELWSVFISVACVEYIIFKSNFDS